MAHVYDLLSLECMMFIMIFLGALCIKTGILTPAGQKELTDLVIYLIFPCYILDSFIRNIGAFSAGGLASVVAASLLLQCATILLGQILYRKTDPRRRTILRYAIIVSNAGFLGLPLVGSIFGDVGMVYASIFLIFQRINNFSVGLSYFTAGPKRGALRRVLTHPCIIVTVIGILIMFLELRPPELVCKVLASVGGCSTPLSMMLIGVILAGAQRGKVCDRDVASYSLLRLVLIPLGMFFVCKLLRMDAVLTGVVVLQAGMPAGTMCVMLGAKYGADALFASRLVIFTTVLSLLTIPLWSLICLYLV